MQVIRLLFFGPVVLLLGDTSDCTDGQRAYHLKLVRNIAEPSLLCGRDSYDIDEQNVADLYPIEKFSEADRKSICEEAVKRANEKAGKETLFKFVEDDEMNRTKAYLVEREDTETLTKPKIILAYKCSAKPDLYVQIHDRRKRGVFALLVSIIIRESDVKSPVRCVAEAMLYVEKLVDEIFPVPWSEVEEAKNDLVENTYDTDKFKEELRMAMCRRALDLDAFVNRNMKFLRGTNTTDVRRLYYLVTDAKNPSRREVALAFRCPTIPAVYLEVRQISDDETFWVSVIVNQLELPPKFHDLRYNYQLKTVLSISETSTPTQTQRLPFYYIFEMLFFPSTITEIDPNRFTERQRARMCKQAFQAVHQEDGKYLEYLEDGSPGKCEFYRINFELGEAKEVQSFKCPTSPPIYLSVGEQGIRQNIWIYVEESEPIDIFPKLNIVGFKMKIVANIVDVPLSTMPELLETEDVQKSAIDPDTLSRGKRAQLCEKAVQLISVMKIKYFIELGSEMSRFYKLETESAERQTIEYHILQAYKCPTTPEILLHITERDGDGNILWIIMKESETLPTMNFTGYQVKIFKEIDPVKTEEVPWESTTIPVEKSAVRIEKLGEERRLQMCKMALKIASRGNIEFLNSTRTEEKKYYAVSKETEGQISKAIVQAFRCPTEPPLYLYIKDDKEKFTVWIMMKEVTRTLIVDDLRYDVMVTLSDIIEVSLSELKKESLGSIKKSAIDTNNRLTEGERVQMCLTAIKRIPGIIIFDFKDGYDTEEKKFYAVNVDSSAETSRSTALLPIFVEAFQCPSKPPIYLHVDEDKDGFTVWVIYKAPPPLIVDDLEFEVKTAKKITELSPAELMREPSESVEKLVVDTDMMPEEERWELCLNALDALPESETKFLKNIKAGKKKFYAVDMYSGLKESPYVRVVVQAFQCPSRPPIYVHINFREFSDAYEGWVILQESLPDPNSMSYRFKVVDHIESAPSTESVSNRALGREDDDSLDTNEFTKEYRSQICAKVVELISKDYVEILPDENPGRNQLYFYHLVESREQEVETSDTKTARAFVCPTAPEIYIEVKRVRRKYVAWVFIRDVDLKDEGEEICYLIQFVESVIPVKLSGTKAAAISNTEVNTNLIKVHKRFRMCGEATEQRTLSDMGIRFAGNSSVEEQYEKHFYTLELASGERYNVEAFGCPTKPPIYLQVHCWKSKCHIVSVIVEKKQPRQPTNVPKEQSAAKSPKKLRELRDSESTKPEELNDSDEETVEYRTFRNSKGESIRVRDFTGSTKSRNLSADSRRSRESIGSGNWGEFSDLEETGSQERSTSQTPKTKGIQFLRPSKEIAIEDEDTFQRGASDSSTGLETYDDIPPPTKLKYTDSIELATEEQISAIPVAPRENSMVNTDATYTKKQLKKMCRAAIQFLQPLDDVQFLNGPNIGRSQLYVINERPLVNRPGKQRMVRAFSCPTEPRLYLEVRNRGEKGVVMTVIVQNESFVTYDLKIAHTITKTIPQISDKRKERDPDAEQLFKSKRFQICKRVFRIVKKIAKSPIEFSNAGSVGDDQSYILNLGTDEAERVLAFQCPIKPLVYLQVQPQKRYVKVSIIVPASLLAPSLEYSESQEFASSLKIDAAKISYEKRLVSDITEDKSSAVKDEPFVPDERDSICAEAIKSFPEVEFTILKGYPEKSKKYILNAESEQQDTVTAFRCATTPPVYVHVEGDADTGFQASVIMVKKKTLRPVSESDSAPSIVIDDIRYTLVPVINIETASKRGRSFNVEDIPPVPDVEYSREEREDICQNSFEVFGPGKDIIKLPERKPKDVYSDYLFAVQYDNIESGEKLISAFRCGTEPEIYIEMDWDREQNIGLANVIIKREHLLDESE